MLDSFLKEVTALSDEFFKGAPYSHEGTSASDALASIEHSRQLVTDSRKRAGELKSGMDIFNIPQPPYKELAAVEKDLELLERIWGMVKEWQDLYLGWKDGSFTDIKASPYVVTLDALAGSPHSLSGPGV